MCVDGKIERERGGEAERESSKDSERKERDPRDQVQSHVKAYAANSSQIPRLGPYLDVLRWMLASEPEIRLFLPLVCTQLEEAAIRELREEVGLSIKELTSPSMLCVWESSETGIKIENSHTPSISSLSSPSS